MLFRFFTLFFFTSIFSLSLSQTTYEPLYSDVYRFLSVAAQKGIIEINDEIKPLSRIYIYKKLDELNDKKFELTEIEKDELEFFLKDFQNEKTLVTSNTSLFQKPTFLRQDNLGRLRFFSFNDPLFKVSFEPILGYTLAKNYGTNFFHQWSGVKFKGYLSDWLGFSFDYRDNIERADSNDKMRIFTPHTGVNPLFKAANRIEYSDVNSTISAAWSWGNFTMGKDHLQWGHGLGGQLVLSQKAPSFPFFKIDINPTEWLSFNYFHGWLNSDVVDSAEMYVTKNPYDSRYLYREKYLASHTITIRPTTGLSISLGESIVYSDRLEFAYLQPIIFFRLIDHYLSKTFNSAGGNAQFFASVSSRNHLPNSHLYGTIFIDEITISGLFDKKKQRNQLGFTLGGSVADPFIENLIVTLEFTKIYPFVYQHYIQTQTYESSSYQLGHWIGHNADQFFAQIEYRPIKNMNVKLWGEFIRKGGDGTLDDQYNKQPQPHFLFGERLDYKHFGVQIKYQVIHDLFAALSYEYYDIADEKVSRLPSIQLGKNNRLAFNIYYGM
ncbi:MAG: hypothetical protein C0425_04205 [Chlorobiaceae bacterium]|nr:hypothetical protein [Chlorobiaceae bacterium]